MATERTGPDSESGVVGLALSGGGFRATAFHLGVLKRLRELGLLSKVHVLSTVSGGSIAGANWVYWNAISGDDLTDDQTWELFERSLILAMAFGIRGLIFLFGFLLPAVLLGVAGTIAVWGWSRFTVLHTGILVILILAVAYLCWHYFAPRLLDLCYEPARLAGDFSQTSGKALRLASGRPVPRRLCGPPFARRAWRAG